jgi:adenine-specific DNA-methyltransferase
VKKIPQMLLGRCEFNKDDYSLNIIDMPPLDLEDDLDDFSEDELTAEAKDNKPVEGTLFE